MRSTVGKGSTFTVTIPVETSWEEKTREDSKKEFANHKILILDDDRLQLQLIQEMLRRLVGDSWQVFACDHVVDALTILHDDRPGLLLMDIEMPEMNGMEMIKHINHARMMVVAMTAHDLSIKDCLFEAGFDDCLFKPFSIDKLANILGVEPAPTEEFRAEKTTTEVERNSHFDSLIAFASGDEEAAREILNTVKQDLAGQLSYLEATLKEEPLPTES